MYINNDYTAVVGSTPLNSNSSPLGSSNEKVNDAPSFGDALNQELKKSEESLKFSKHALGRLQERDISLDSELIGQVTDAVSQAQEKGIHDALILGQNKAFIVNVPSRTVITTMNSDEMKQNIITNIDGTVLI